ncbi:MAG: aldo/keto reductase [Gammaproteobacteria bacterium]|nr:aldo/keto reductase [Gammaproteobacteria bacterium]
MAFSPPRVALGCMGFGSSRWRSWVLDEQESLEVLARALELGITFFDTANVYSTGRSERVLGRMLRRAAARERVIVATKLYFPVGEGEMGLSAGNVKASCEASLRRLNIETIDLLQIHLYDEATPVEETMEALARLVREGKVRHLGASNLRAWQLAKMNFTARANGWPEFESVQAHYNLLYREEERDLLPFCVDQGIAVLPWSPLARGRLARPRAPLSTPRARVDDVADQLYGAPRDEVLDVLAEVSGEYGIKPACAALAWLWTRPGVTTPVVGVTRLEHIEDALAAAEMSLPDAMLSRLNAAYSTRPYIGLPETASNQTVLETIDSRQ